MIFKKLILLIVLKNLIIQLTVTISVISSKDTDEERVMHSKIDSIEIMIIDKSDEVVK